MKRIPFYPLLLAAYPAIFLFSHNIKEIPISQMLFPLAASLFCTLVLWGGMFCLVRDGEKSALMVTVALPGFFLYGRLYDVLASLDVPFAQHRHLVAIAVMVVGYSCYFVTLIKERKILENATVILNVVSLTLFVMNVVNISVHYANKPRQFENAQTAIGQKKIIAAAGVAKKPDIYLIIPDEYGSVNTMKKVYAYDNTSFTNHLESKGFYIASGQSKSIGTSESVPSIINMGEIGKFPADLSKSMAQDFLESIGYKTIWFGIEPYYDSLWHIRAHKYFNFYNKDNTTEFERLYWGTTLLRAYYDYDAENRLKNYYRNSFNKTLNAFEDILADTGPKFVVLHLMSPHQPFVFGANGEEVPFKDRFNWDESQYYRNQYIYLTKRLTKLVDTVIEKTDRKAIILIQSDHGPRGGITEGDIKVNKDIVPERYRHEVFQAYYLPDNGAASMYKEISPINTLRVVFNHYFNAGFELLGDYKYSER